MWSSGVVTSEVVLMGSLVYTLCLLAVTSGHEVRALGVPLRHHRVPVMMASEPPEATVALDATWCDVARIKCAHRQGCALALAHYVTDCADLVAGRTDRCHGHCQRALIALVSTDEGTSLVNCNCSTIEFCEQSKQRLEVCRPQVEEATAPDTVVSCTIAKWICLADIECSTALHYYHQNCRSMFKGNKCSFRCLNSLSILNRQDKAAKLQTCYCDGTEDFPCQRIKANTERLCVNREDNETESNEIQVIRRSQSSSGPASGQLLPGPGLAVCYSLMTMTVMLAGRPYYCSSSS